MRAPQTQPILSRLRGEDFIGRDADLDRLLAFGTPQFVDSPDSSSILQGYTPQLAILQGPVGVGKSELLRTCFDRLFLESGDVFPIYYQLKRDSLEPGSFARDYLSGFLAQFNAFRAADANLLNAAGELSEVLSHASPEDYDWLRDLVDAFVEATTSDDPRMSLDIAFAAPRRAAEQTGLTPLVMYDDVHLLVESQASPSDAPVNTYHSFLDSLKRVAGSSATVRYTLCGYQRLLSSLFPPDQLLVGSLQFMRLEPVLGEAVERFIHSAAAQRRIAVSEATVELMVRQLDSDLLYIRALLDCAATNNSAFRTFMDFERAYTEELAAGRIAYFLGARIRELAADSRSRRAVLEALACVNETAEGVPIASVLNRMGLDPIESERVLGRLHARELLNVGYRFVTRSGDPVLADYVRATYRNEVLEVRKPIVGTPLLAEKLKQAHELMMARYVRGFESQLLEALSSFDAQAAPSSLFDAAEYEKLYRGMSRVQIGRMLDQESERISLPQIVEIQDAGGGDHSGISWRLFLAIGFEAGIYSEANETCWAVTLMNSNEPLDVETIARMEERIVSALGKTPVRSARGVRWYISKEGFSAAATQRLEAENAFLSTFAQLDLLSSYLVSLQGQREPSAATAEFELVIPVEDEAELIAAQTAEQIARGADFEQQAVNQIKTAVIEACINAAEHGLSPDKKIYQRFAIYEDRIIITVSNKGRIFGAAGGHPPPRAASRKARGRGLQIIRTLMDEAHFQRTDDGASLVMTKFLKRPENQ